LCEYSLSSLFGHISGDDPTEVAEVAEVAEVCRGAVEVLQRCCRGVAEVLQRCCRGVAEVLQRPKQSHTPTRYQSHCVLGVHCKFVE
jgi:hypothetical protein